MNDKIKELIEHYKCKIEIMQDVVYKLERILDDYDIMDDMDERPVVEQDEII